jgi:uncharacterized membrane protein
MQPNVSVMGWMFLRGVICTMLMLVWTGCAGGFRKNLIAPINRTNIVSLTFRCLQGGLSVFISFLCIKYFNVSTVGIVCSMTPIFVCIMAYFILGERMKLFD